MREFADFPGAATRAAFPFSPGGIREINKFGWVGFHRGSFRAKQFSRGAKKWNKIKIEQREYRRENLRRSVREVLKMLSTTNPFLASVIID